MLLTTKEVANLAQLMATFPTVYSFTLKQSGASGIGTSTTAEFSLNGIELSKDITDYSCW